MVFLTCLLVILAAGFGYQTWRHERFLARIPLRVHVNGSRGKSSVTRLIAAGLRAGGIRTVAKTTGTKPRFINPDGSEVPIVRAGSANIIEQVQIVRRAAQLGAEALVVECMAIKPELQGMLEDRMIRSTHSVLTNVRADHLDEMGPRMDDVARSLGRTIPRGGQFYTTEPGYLEILGKMARERGSTFHVVPPESVENQVLRRFTYIEHAENVALALAVCTDLGIDRNLALAGMAEATPDPGAMRMYRVLEDGREIRFINGFAVNDPDSYVLAWDRLAHLLPNPRRVIGLVVCRADRIERSQQLGELLGERLPVDLCVVAGKETAPFRRHFRRANQTDRPLFDMEGASPGEIYTAIRAHAGETALVVFGIGNIVGLGEGIVEEFRLRSVEPQSTDSHREHARTGVSRQEDRHV